MDIVLGRALALPLSLALLLCPEHKLYFLNVRDCNPRPYSRYGPVPTSMVFATCNGSAPINNTYFSPFPYASDPSIQISFSSIPTQCLRRSPKRNSKAPSRSALTCLQSVIALMVRPERLGIGTCPQSPTCPRFSPMQHPSMQIFPSGTCHA